MPVLAYEPAGDRAVSDNGSDGGAVPSFGGKLKCNDADKDGAAPTCCSINGAWCRPTSGRSRGSICSPLSTARCGSKAPAPRWPRWHAVHQGGCGYTGRPCRRRALRWLPYQQAGRTSHQTDSAPRPVRQTAYQEPVAKPQGEAIPAPQPIPSATRDTAHGPRCRSPSRCLSRASIPPRMGRAWSRSRTARA